MDETVAPASTPDFDDAKPTYRHRDDEHVHRPLASYRLGLRPTTPLSRSTCIDCRAPIRFVVDEGWVAE